MTSFHGLSALKAIALGAALSMTAGFAFAADGSVSADQIVNALRAKSPTRGRSAAVPQTDAAARAKEISFVGQVRDRKTRSLSLNEREQIAEIASAKPKIDLEIRFDYNSAEISKTSLPAVQELGKALSDANLRGSTFVIAGHTDAIGGDPYNQKLSVRRAESVKAYLVTKGIEPNRIYTEGKGKKQPVADNKTNEGRAKNRRVEIEVVGTRPN